MTNIEKIKSMTSEELAYAWRDYIGECRNCPCDSEDYIECFEDKCDCAKIIKQWLELEY